jgi:hypothetical protein
MMADFDQNIEAIEVYIKHMDEPARMASQGSVTDQADRFRISLGPRS